MSSPVPVWPARRLRLDIEVVRGAIVESRHRVQAAVVGPLGEPFAATEEPALVTSFRSAAKPFQLLPFVERGYAERFRLTEEHLAVMAASHTGSAEHVALVTEILERLGLSDRHLACGVHDPLDADSLARLRAQPELRSPLYNNCSGKHAGMLGLALAEGWPTGGYELPDHPVQRLMRETVAAVCGVPAASLTLGVDGCSVSVFGLPLTAMARGYARFASASPSGDARERALARIRAAMQRHPRLTGGAQRFSTVLMETDPRFVAKGGAEGLECLGLESRALGFAIKVEDGHARAVAPAVLGLLEACELIGPAAAGPLASWASPELRNHAGRVTGALRVRVEALAPYPS